MKRFLSLSVLSIAAAGAFFWTPATSHAQSPVGVRVQVGGLGFSYNSGYPYTTYAPAYVPCPTTTVVPAPVVPVSPYVYYPRTYSYYGPYRPYRHHDHYHHHHR